MKKFEPIDSSADLKAKWQNQILIIFFAFVLIAVVGLNLNSIVSAYRVFTYDSMIDELRDYKNKNGIESLKNINSNFVAWVSIEDLGIDLPVVATNSTTDEDFYLTHDFKHRNNPLGSPYQKHDTQIGQTTNTQFIGHSVFNSTMFYSKKQSYVFGDLKKYTQQNSTYNHKIVVQTANQTYTFVVFSVIEFDSRDVTSKVSNIYNTSNISSQSQFDTFYSDAMELSCVKLNQTAEYGDKFLTMFTCSEDDLSHRIMVIAKQI